MPTLEDFAAQSAYSDPGPFTERLLALPDDLDTLCWAARNTIAHYRAELPDLPRERWGEVDLRWLASILALDAGRHPAPLLTERPVQDQVAGCCRDHTLFVVGALRARGVPARSRVGFADYFTPGYHHDHVIAEHHDGTRWVRTDPELAAGSHPFDTRDIPVGADAPFATAAHVWQGYRAGVLDPGGYGVFPGSPIGGRDFIRSYVTVEVAHRFGDELLLWDEWGTGGGDVDPEVADRLADEVADLLVRSDSGDEGAEGELSARYHQDVRLHPGDHVTQRSPFGRPALRVDLPQSAPTSRIGALGTGGRRCRTG